MNNLSPAQIETLRAKWDIACDGLSFRRFVASARPAVFHYGAVMVEWQGRTLVIERDGTIAR